MALPGGEPLEVIYMHTHRYTNTGVHTYSLCTCTGEIQVNSYSAVYQWGNGPNRASGFIYEYLKTPLPKVAGNS